MTKLIVALMLMFAVVACEEERNPHLSDDVYVPGTFGAAACPAPGTRDAESYHAHGGADSALQWYLLMHALSDPHPQEVVHHVFHPAPVYVQPRVVRQVVYQRPVYVPSSSSSSASSRAAPVITKQVSKTSRDFSITTSSKSATGVVPKSTSYGLKPTTTVYRPSSSPARFSGGRR